MNFAGPTTVVTFYCEETDSKYEKLHSEATEEDWENFYDCETEEITLAEMKDLFSPHIKRGWIEIACCSNEKSRYVKFESIRIYSSGQAERLHIQSGPWVEGGLVREVIEAPTT